MGLWQKPAEELYDIKNDPDCLNNLAGQTNLADVQQLLKTTLLNDLKNQGDPRIAGNGAFLIPLNTWIIKTKASMNDS